MTELFRLIIEFIKVHFITFWTGLIILSLLSAFIIWKIVKRRQLKIKVAKQKLAEYDKIIIETERTIKAKTAMILTTVNTTKENKGKDIKLESNTDKPNNTNKSTHVKNGRVMKLKLSLSPNPINQRFYLLKTT